MYISCSSCVFPWLGLSLFKILNWTFSRYQTILSALYHFVWRPWRQQNALEDRCTTIVVYAKTMSIYVERPKFIVSSSKIFMLVSLLWTIVSIREAVYIGLAIRCIGLSVRFFLYLCGDGVPESQGVPPKAANDYPPWAIRISFHCNVSINFCKFCSQTAEVFAPKYGYIENIVMMFLNTFFTQHDYAIFVEFSHLAALFVS